MPACRLHRLALPRDADEASARQLALIRAAINATNIDQALRVLSAFFAPRPLR